MFNEPTPSWEYDEISKELTVYVGGQKYELGRYKTRQEASVAAEEFIKKKTG